MKPILAAIFSFLWLTPVFAQQSDSLKITGLKEKVQVSTGGEKVQYLHRLATLMERTSDKNFEPYSIQCIQLALALDSLKIAAQQTTSLVFYYNNVTATPEKALPYANRIIKLENGIKSRRDVGFVYLNRGDSYSFLNKKKKAILDYDRAIEIFESIKKPTQVAKAKMYKAEVLSKLGKPVEASQTLQEALEVFEKEKDTFNIISARNLLATLYSKYTFYEAAKRERDILIGIAELSDNHSLLVPLYYNTSTDAKKTGRPKKQIVYLKKALTAAQNSDRKQFFEPLVLTKLAQELAAQNKVKQAKIYLNRFYENPASKSPNFKKNVLQAESEMAFAVKNYQQSIDRSKELLEILYQAGDWQEIAYTELLLSKAFREKGNYEQALLHYEKQANIHDSIKKVERSNALAYYQTLYETEKRDRAIERQKASIDLLNQENAYKTKLIWLGALAGIVLLVLIYAVRSARFSKKKEHLQKVFSQNLIRSLEEERKRIAKDLHDGIGQSLLLIKNSMVINKNKEGKDLKLIDGTIDEIREISHNLHPYAFEKTGLVKSLENMVANFNENSDIFFSIDIGEAEKIEKYIAKDKHIFIFRMAQEALNNVLKHSKADACKLEMYPEGNQIFLKIKDNGVGFKEKPSLAENYGLGMKTLQERAAIIMAELNIFPGKKGTVIQLAVSKV